MKRGRSWFIRPFPAVLRAILFTLAISATCVLCTSSAWAGLVAEWNGDFDVTQKNGWTLTVGTGNTFANGVITIGASSTTPVTIAHSTGYQRVTVVVGIKTSSADTVGTVVSPVYGNNASPYAYLDVENSSSQIWYGWYDGSTYDDDWDDKDNTVTWSNDSVQYVTFVADTATASGTEPRGSTIYHNGSVVDGRKNGLVSSSAYVKTIGVGGNPSREAGGMLNGAIISYVAIYDAALTSSTTPAVASASVPDNLNLMYLISGNTIGTSGGVALANDAGYGDVVPTVWHSGYRNYASGKYGNASKLNGGTLGFIKNDGDGLGLNTSEGFTISFWANLASDLGNWRDFLAFRVGNVNCRFEKMDSNAFAMYSSGGTPFENVAYTVDTWSHYAVVFAPNNGGLKVYKDGTEVVSVTESVPSGTLYQVGMGQGRNGSDANSAFRTNDSPGNSLIDDLAIFKGALSASQISAIATSESAISGPVYGMYRTVSFATPQESVWAAANLPNFAKTVTYGSGTVSFANDAYSKSTVNGKAARLTSIVGGSFTEIDGYVKYQQTADNTSDVYLRVAGDTTATRVNGVGESDYSKGTRTFNGNVLLNLTGSAVVDHVMGAGYKGGDPTALTGDVGVVIDGNAVVKGTVLGGWSSVHNYKPKIDGSTYVLVKNVQGTGGATAEGSIPNGYIMGGSSYQGNYGRSWITQNTSVAINLPNDATGSFAKGIVGGSYGHHSTEATKIDGSTSVTITAPDTVAFPSNIVGACWANLGTASVGGNSSVTLNGGTYTGTIYAGGYGSGTPTVTGNATLTLNGGVYAGATLLAGAASGTKSLVISGDTDLSSTTIANSGFGVLSVAATKTLTLGTKRLTGDSDPTLASASAGVVSFTLTAEEYAAGYANLMKCAGNDMTDKFVIYYNDEDITSSLADKVTVKGGHLVYLDASSYESTIAAETSVAWSDIVWTKADSSSATMASASVDASAEATLTVNGTLTISSPVTFAGILTIEGNGTIVFTGNASLSVGQELSIASGIALDFSGLTNLSNMGRDTIISAALGLEVNSSSTVFPSAWTCTSSTTSTGFIISGFKNASDSVNINIIGWDGASIPDNEDAGFYPVKGSLWNQILHQTATSAVNGTFDVSEVVADGTAKTDAGLSASVTASTTYSAETAPSNANAKLMKGYLNDGGSGANITVRNIPYSQYAVLIYVGTDSSNGSFRPITVNGTEYCGSGASTVSGSSNWGDYDSTRGTVTPTEGSNFLKVTGQTSSTLVIQGLTQSGNNRCSIAGIQIVNTGTRPSIYAGTINTSTATFAPSEGSTGITKTSAGSWSNANTSRIVLTNIDQDEVVLTIGESIATKSFKIVGSGKITLSLAAEKTIEIADGTFDLSEFSGTLCVDSSISETLFAGVATNGGTVRFLGTNLSFAGAASLPLGRVALKSATLTRDLQLNNRTLVIEDGDSVILNGSNDSRTSMQFAISGGSLTVKGNNFWFGNGSTFTQTGGTVTLESTSTSMDSNSCVIFGFSSGGGTVNISGGTFDMSNATLCLWTGTTSLTLSGNAVFKVKGIWSNDSKNVTVGGSSKLILTGTQGISNNLGSLTMNGGTIEFQETATISEPLTLTSGVESTINVADTKSATISTVALSAVPAVGDKIFATNGGTITVSAITAGGVAQALDLSYWSDGVYVAAAKYDSVNYPSVAAAIAVADDANLADITLLNGCTTVPDGYMLVDGHVAKVRAELIVYGQSSGTKYASIEEAISDSNPQQQQYVKVYESATVNTDKSTFMMECAENVEVEVVCTKPAYKYNKSSDPIAGSIYSYSVTEAAATFTWNSDVSEGVWGTKDNWLVGGASVDRAPNQSFDTVVINSAATISVGNDISTVNRIEVGAAVTLTAAEESSPSITATSGIVLTSAAATLTVSGVTLSPAPTTSVADKCVKYANSVYSVVDAINGGNAGYVDDGVAIITNTSSNITIPTSATSVTLSFSTGNSIVLTSTSVNLTESGKVAVYATDANGAKTGTDISGAFKVTTGEGYTYKVELNGAATVGEVSVKPVVDSTAEDPMHVADGGTPRFAVKAIDGLWYAVEAADSPTGFDSATRGTPVQAEDGTASPVAPGFSGTVKYYKIVVGASRAAVGATEAAEE